MHERHKHIHGGVADTVLGVRHPLNRMIGDQLQDVCVPVSRHPSFFSFRTS